MILFILLYTVFAILCCGIVHWIVQYFQLRKLLEKIPGPKNLPFIGVVLERKKIPIEDQFKWFNDLCFQYDAGIVQIWLGTEPIIVIRKPQQMEAILPSNTQITKTRIYDFLRPWLGDGLLTATGYVWFNHRRLITPAFHFGVLEEYRAVMREKVKILKENIELRLKANPKAPINTFDLSIKYTLDTICDAAMGINVNSQRDEENVYVKALHEFSRLSSERIFKPWLTWDAIFKQTEKGKQVVKAINTMHSFTEEVIKQKQIEMKEKIHTQDEATNDDTFEQRKKKAFLDLLLDSSNNASSPLTFKELRQEVDTFMFAGHDTTAAAISWALFALGNAPKIQAKVHEELEEIFGENNEIATTKQLMQLKYLDLVIKESLRMYPSVPQISRCLSNDTVIDNYVIPKGTSVSINIYQMHHDPAVWDNPEVFDPDRFLPENSHKRHAYAYVPFSAGPRNCIGQKFALLEIKTALTEILRTWKVVSVLKPSELKLVSNFIIRPHNKKVEIYFIPLRENI